VNPGKQPNTHSEIDRRTVLKAVLSTAAASILPSSLALATPIRPWSSIKNSINPRWYGFNLLEYFSTDRDWMKYFPYQPEEGFKEDDFRWMSGWGFNWVCLPMDYRFWTDPADPMKIEEKKIEPIDRAIRMGEKYGIHVELCLHRAPGFCTLDGMDQKRIGIHITREKTSVFDNQATQDAFIHQWVYFAKRYKSISSRWLSFDPISEPVVRPSGFIGFDSYKNKTKTDANGVMEYVRLARKVNSAIRGIDPRRLIVSDSFDHKPVPELFNAGTIQNAHDYFPIEITHYGLPWGPPQVQIGKEPVPTWPLKDAKGNIIVDRRTIQEKFRLWEEPAQHGVPIHFVEMGCSNHTPPNVAYAWFNDSLDVINELHSGWGLWNFRGPIGILDTQRAGTKYKNWYGHQLDFTLLNLLRSKMNV
jgi:endoglucanase